MANCARPASAGQAFAEFAAKDPATKATIDRLRSLGVAMSLVAKELAPTLRTIREQSDQQLSKLYSNWAADQRRIEQSWEREFGAPMPKHADDWDRWAAEVGVSGERILAGKYTLAKLLPIIEGYLRRLQRLDKRRPGRPTDDVVATRRADVARLTAERKTQGQIAELLQIPIDTVKDDRKANKLGDRISPPPASGRKN